MEVVELPDAAVFDARRVIFKWPFAPTRVDWQLVLFVIGRTQTGLRRLCGSPSVFWAEEWNSCAV